ncbi:oligoribonuclease [Microbacterium esteraromaticum]|uniref:Oligoribonuclease n=1 Tax=Microbacterium esteraromaticum TaxID=57043 RepID=A0A939IV38_9MICO|nr:oligoribonuclease [Microbacterium esteraromaticum]MBN7792671.1 oligoribonuclease [Microbacterium esteraromaticum]MBN8206061.1 oligoribonuclease [Microbacterium esteraromaticum]MBN8416216.1 oligoribonuclease [Microbacterium esteraromaticum]MBN8423427.1 oligoribonuclease [Microbacterium esteraromaticum]MBY6061327.1 oligoribonuclease [Microbacterium esteraromaticum]
MVSASENDRLVWIDCEMTGLDLAVDELVEIAVVITDFELRVIDPGFQVVIKPSDAALANMGDFVTEMHRTSGLIDEIPHGVSLAEAEAQTLAYIKRFVPMERKAPLAGNTIGTDRMFLAKYMPGVDGHLHYRNVDVSSIKELSRRWYPRVFFQAPEKNGGHRALADILESIRELHYYREAVFVAEPGPSSDEAKDISSRTVSSFTQNM